MGFGIAALGNAVGAATKGYMEGSRFRSEMEDAEARRGLIKLQSEEAGLKLDAAKRDKAYMDERQKIYDEEAAGGAVAPTEAAPAGTAAATSTGGIAVPGAAPKAAAGTAAPSTSDLARMEKLITRQQQLDLKYGKIDPMQAVEGMKKFRMYQQEGIIDGLRYFEQTGDGEGAIARINATGQQKMPPGTTFMVKEEEAIPGSGVKVKNVYAVSPDGKASVNYRDLLRSSLSPKEALSLDTETGVKLAELAWRKDSDEKLRDIQLKQAEGQIAHWKALEAQQREQTRISLERLGIDKDKYRFDKIEQGLTKAYGQALDMFGYVKLSPEKMDMLTPEQRADMSKRLMQANVVSAIFEKNFDLKNGKPNITVTQAAEAARFAATNRSSILTDDEGATYVNIGKQKIFVPAPPKPTAAPAPAPGAPAQPAAAAPASAPRPGVQPPPTVEQAQAQFRASQQFVAQAKGAAAQDPEIQTLQSQQQAAIKAGRAAEANNLLAKRNQLLAERYNLTPLGGIADPSKLNQQ